MTAKDAVKCKAFPEPHWWFVTAETELAPALEKRVLELVTPMDDRKTALGQETT
jgi:tetraacyldisaccharide-1-P 4'-kinase